MCRCRHVNNSFAKATKNNRASKDGKNNSTQNVSESRCLGIRENPKKSFL
jgi:hypothetical protein